MNKKIIAVVLAVLMAFVAVAFTACNGKKTEEPKPSETVDTNDTEKEATTAAPVVGSDLEYIRNKGTLVVGMTIFAPMNYYDDQTKELTGFETDFAKAVGEKLGVDIEFQEIDWNNKIFELKANNIDCIWNGMTIREDLAEEIDFSDAYMANKQVAVVRTADAETYKDLASIAGAAVVAEQGSAGEEAAKADEGLSQNYLGVSAQSDALKEVKASTADVAIIDAVMAYSMVGEDTDFSDLTVVDVFDESADEEYGIGFRKGSDLTAEVNKIMAELAADGTLKDIAQKYGLESRIIID